VSDSLASSGAARKEAPKEAPKEASLTFRRVGTNEIATRARPARRGARRPAIVWLGGFMSDMDSTKARALDDFAARAGRACLRFDYSGHGRSGGRFIDGRIGLWSEEALAMVRAAGRGRVVLVGSSMGAWIALLVARQAMVADAHESGESGRLAGLVLIAPAVDFTEVLMWERLDEAIRDQITRDGLWLRPSTYGQPYPITRGLIEEGRQHLLLGGPIRAHAPVHILQGMEDPDVPWRHALRLVEHLAHDAVVITLVRDGDHRLSRDEDIARLIAAVAAIA
jgi:pimeloyl-ACP methyl ester carboxylesterase